MIYILDRNGGLIDSLLQPEGIGGNFGIRDLAWDGELIWGTGSNVIGGFTTAGEVQATFEGIRNPNQAIAWDSNRELLWVCGITTDIYGFRRNGELADTLDRGNFRIYGLAYWQDDPDDCQLYIFHNPAGGSQNVHKMNPETGDTIFVRNLSEVADGNAAGAFITKELNGYDWMSVNIANNESNDRIDVWQLSGIIEWMETNISEGIVQTGQEQSIQLTLYAPFPSGRVFTGGLLFRHNASGGETALPIKLSVGELAVETSETCIPDQIGIRAIYPNPFNSVIHINYSLQKAGYIQLVLYDLTGRQVDVIEHDFKPGGCHTTAYDASPLPSGVYILNLITTERSSVEKMLLIK